MPQMTPACRSSYYPPRAGRARMARRIFSAWRFSTYVDRIHMPRLQASGRTLAAMAVPGLAFYFKGPRIFAKLIWLAFPVLFLVFLAGLGTVVAEVAFGLMIGTHVLSVSHVLRPVMIRCRLPFQMVFGVVLFAAISVLLYNPVRGLFDNHVAMPLEIHGRTLVMNPRASPLGIQRGDRIVYRIPASGGNGVVVQPGLGFRAIWGMPGERVVFDSDAVSIDGRRYPLRGSQPGWGDLVVPDDCWFIWPELSIRNHGRGESEVSTALRRLAVVPQSRFVGRPYAWWFFRAQKLE